jgi:hypothetical protein
MSRVDTGSWLVSTSPTSGAIHGTRVDIRTERARVFAERRRLLDDLDDRIDELLEEVPPTTVDI